MAEFEYDKERAGNIARSLYAVFTWEDTEQGHSFWGLLRNAFYHLTREEELEFEECIETAVSRYVSNATHNDFAYNRRLASAICEEISYIFSWDNAPFPKAWTHLYWAFCYLAHGYVKDFNDRVKLFVEKVRG